MEKLFEFISYFSPLHAWFHFVNRKKLRVLCYHDVVDPIQFDSQMKYLSKHYHPVSIRDVEDFILSGKQLPDRSVLVTFDDGHISVVREGLSILQKHKIPFVIFIITGLINTKMPFWWEEVRLQPDGVNILREIKKASNDDRLEAIESFRNKTGNCPLGEQLTTKDIESILKMGGTVGNHTHTHPILSNSDDKVMNDEFKWSIDFFQRNGIEGGGFLAYPNGGTDERVMKAAAGFRFNLAFAFNHSLHGKSDPHLSISRLSVNSTTSIRKLQLILSGVHSFLLRNFK